MFYLKKREEKRRSSDVPILTSNGKGYGSNSYHQEGKSKFYDGNDLNVPVEEREGQSRFYRQHAMDNKSPDKDGFSDIFNGEAFF